MSVDTAAVVAAAAAAADDLDIVITHTLQLFQQRLQRIEFLITGNLAEEFMEKDDDKENDGADDGNNSGTVAKVKTSKNKSFKKQSLKQRLRSVDASLRNLSARSAGVRQVLELRKCCSCVEKRSCYTNHISDDKHPQLLKPIDQDEELDLRNDRVDETSKNTTPQDRQPGSEQPDEPSGIENANLYPISSQLALVLSISQTYTHTASQLTLLQDLHVPPTAPIADLAAILPRLARVQQVQSQQEAEVVALAKRTGVLLLRWFDGSVIGGGRCWVDWEGRLREVDKLVRRREVRREKERVDEHGNPSQ